MKVLTIVTHPRTDSLTHQVAKYFISGLKEAGHETDVIDLYRHDFNPILTEKDEPQWNSPHQHYSKAVHVEMERMKNYDGLAFVFPLWWWSMPAMMKGYIDRVWNYDFAYGPNKLHHEHVLWLSLAGAPIERFKKRKYDQMMEHYFNIGLAEYCGIKSSRFELLYETIRVTDNTAQILFDNAFKSGLHYAERRDN
ncbi:NAD(P)H oxidoreductase [Salipaludibacillus sp. HK11]|uniref:NAD(P)H oxidoreductase n=1 Tax=Salipaludibacillus sp. HK11 TaxID=3394320 RepID=UPI0039FD7908